MQDKNNINKVADYPGKLWIDINKMIAQESQKKPGQLLRNYIIGSHNKSIIDSKSHGILKNQYKM